MGLAKAGTWWLGCFLGLPKATKLVSIQSPGRKSKQEEPTPDLVAENEFEPNTFDLAGADSDVEDENSDGGADINLSEWQDIEDVWWAWGQESSRLRAASGHVKPRAADTSNTITSS